MVSEPTAKVPTEWVAPVSGRKTPVAVSRGLQNSGRLATPCRGHSQETPLQYRNP